MASVWLSLRAGLRHGWRALPALPQVSAMGTGILLNFALRTRSTSPWLLFADSAGVGSQADVPVPLVLLVIPVTLILAVLLAAVPGWTAARIRPALVLRSE